MIYNTSTIAGTELLLNISGRNDNDDEKCSRKHTQNKQEIKIKSSFLNKKCT